MKKLMKVIAVLAALCLLAAGGATLYIKAKYPPERIKALVAEQVKKRLHRELRLGGVSVGLWRGASLENVALSENPGFAKGTFLSAERVSVEPFLLPLLKGRVVIKRVSLVKPVVNVVRLPDGRFNFSDLASPSPAETPAAPGGSGAPSVPLLVNAVSVQGGQLSFDDRAGGMKASVKDLAVSVTAFSLANPFSAAVDCAVQAAPAGKPALSGTVSFKGRLALGGEGRADIEKLSLAADGAAVDVMGGIRNFSAPDMDLTVAVKKLEAKALAPFASLPDGLKEAGLQGKLNIKGGMAAVALKGSLKAAAKGLGADLGLDGSVKDPAGDPALNLSLSLDNLRLDKSPLAPGVGLSGPNRAEVKLRGTLQKLAADVSFSADGAELKYGGLFAKPAGTPLKLSAAAAVTGQKDVNLSSAQLTLAGAAVDLRGTVTDAPGAGRLDMTVKAAPFDLAPFAKMVPMLAEYKPAGKTGLDATVKGTAGAPIVRGTLTLAGLGATPVEGITLAGLTGAASFTGNTMDLPDLKGRFNGEALSLKASVRNFARPEVTAEGSLAALDLGKLQAAFASTAPAQGAPAAAPKPPPAGPPPIAKAKGAFKIGRLTHPYYLGNDFAFAWDLTDLGPDLSRLNGTANLSATDGKIRNLPLADKINKLLKRDGADITYSRLGGHASIARGVLNTQDFAVDSSQADISAKGTVNLADTTADLRAVFKLAKGAVGGSTEEWFADDNGRVTLEATIKGPLTDPVVRPDLGKAAARAAKSLVEKNLDKLLGGGGNAPQNADGGGQDAKQKALDQGQKLLRGLFKKKS